MHTWDSQLKALNHLRNQQNNHLNKPALFAFVLIIAFVGSAMRFGIETAVAGIAVIGFIAANLFMRGKFKLFSQWSRTGNALNAKSTLIEERILQSVAGSVDSILRFKMASPPLSAQFRNSNLVRQKIDYINQSRCLTGLHQDIAFCTTYVDAGHYSTYKDSEGREQQIPKPVFQGLFLVADFPKAKEGWVTLQTDGLEKLGWLANEWRYASDENYVRMENVEFEKSFHVRASSPVEGHLTLSSDVMERLASFKKLHPNIHHAMSLKDQTVMMLVPMRVNPFVIRDNPNLWTDELDRLRDVASVVADFVQSINRASIKINEVA